MRGRRFRASAATVLAFAPIGLALAIGGCATGVPVASGRADVTVAPSITPAIAGTAAQERSALAARGLQLSVPQVPYRPAEAPRLASAPRGVFQVQLPDDQSHGFFVIYDLGSSAAATEAANEQVAYVQSGPGRVQFPADAQFVFRQVGQTLVFYAWSPSAATDPSAPEIAAALASVGTPIEIRA